MFFNQDELPEFLCILNTYAGRVLANIAMQLLILLGIKETRQTGNGLFLEFQIAIAAVCTILITGIVCIRFRHRIPQA